MTGFQVQQILKNGKTTFEKNTNKFSIKYILTEFSTSHRGGKTFMHLSLPTSRDIFTCPSLEEKAQHVEATPFSNRFHYNSF